MRAHHVLKKPCHETAREIKEQESNMPEPVFHVVTEYPQVPHVADHVEPPSMEEHMREKTQAHVEKADTRDLVEVRHQIRDHAVMIEKGLELPAEAHLVEKDKTVGDDDRDGDQREGA